MIERGGVTAATFQQQAANTLFPSILIQLFPIQQKPTAIDDDKKM